MRASSHMYGEGVYGRCLVVTNQYALRCVHGPAWNPPLIDQRRTVSSTSGFPPDSPRGGTWRSKAIVQRGTDVCEYRSAPLGVDRERSDVFGTWGTVNGRTLTTPQRNIGLGLGKVSSIEQLESRRRSRSAIERQFPPACTAARRTGNKKLDRRHRLLACTGEGGGGARIIRRMKCVHGAIKA